MQARMKVCVFVCVCLGKRLLISDEDDDVFCVSGSVLEAYK